MSTTNARWLTFEGVEFSKASFVRVWLPALATYGVGDVVTTVSLMLFSPLYVESNPVIAASIDIFGGGGFLALKLLMFYACVGVSVWGGVLNDDPILYYSPPLMLAVAGAVATWSNLTFLL